MIKLVASDMDGTLLDSNRKLNPEFNKILKDLKDKRILFAAVSGRDIGSLKQVFKGMEEDIVFASNNGNYIVYKDEVIFENFIEKHMVEKVVPLIRKYCKHHTIYCTKNSIYSESIFPCIISLRFGLRIRLTKDITKIEDKIIKISTFGKEKTVLRALEHIKALNDELMITPSGKSCFDICRLGGNKKQGIIKLQEKFNIEFDETMVFGDHLNDLEMMESAFYSYAMENAKNEVKKNARFMAKTNDENGVLEVIKEVVLSNTSKI